MGVSNSRHQIDELKREKILLTTRIRHCEQDLRNNQRSPQELLELNSQNTKLSELNSQKTKLSEEVSALNSQKTKVSDELSALNNKKTKVSEELSNLLKELSNLNKLKSDLSQELLELNTQKINLNKSIADQNKELNRKKSQYDAFTSEFKSINVVPDENKYIIRNNTGKEMVGVLVTANCFSAWSTGIYDDIEKQKQLLFNKEIIIKLLEFQENPDMEEKIQEIIEYMRNSDASSSIHKYYIRNHDDIEEILKTCIVIKYIPKGQTFGVSICDGRECIIPEEKLFIA